MQRSSPVSSSFRPERQFDVSNVRIEDEAAETNVKPKITERSDVLPESLSSFYPQSSFWSEEGLNNQDDADNYDENERVPETNSNNDLETADLAINLEDNNDYLESIYEQLNKTLGLLKIKEVENRHKIHSLLNTNNEYPDVNDDENNSDYQDIIYVNIWNNVNGELQITNKKPMRRNEFDQMESIQDFSKLFINSQPSINTEKASLNVYSGLKQDSASGFQNPLLHQRPSHSIQV